MCSDIHKLILAAQPKCTGDLREVVHCPSTLLHSFSVGTEKEKRAPLPPDPKKLCPIRDISRLKSPVETAKTRMGRDVIAHKQTIVLRTMSAWPRYASHGEDFYLRSEVWKTRYGEKRVIFWDNTDIEFVGKPGDPDVQRLTYSSYYGGNVAKAGVFLQLCGWLGGFEPWTGAISDTDYFERAGILEQQEEFQKSDTSSTLAFINILDKGYRCNLAA
jgi:hypothetical protein